MVEKTGHSKKESNEKGNPSPFIFRTSKIGADSMVNNIVENENEIMKFMVEDLCQWLSQIVGQNMELTPANFFSLLRDGVILCRLANSIQDYAIEAAKTNDSSALGKKIKYKSSKLCDRDKSKFHSRENVCKFLDWCRSHGVPTPMLFESNDIVVGGTDGGREVIICLMNLAKRFSIEYHVPAPETVKMEVEQEIKIKKEKLSNQNKAQTPDEDMNNNLGSTSQTLTPHEDLHKSSLKPDSYKPTIPKETSENVEEKQDGQTMVAAEQNPSNTQDEILLSDVKSHEPTLTSMDESLIDCNETNFESTGSYHFNNYAVTPNDYEIPTGDLESLKKLIGDNPFDDTGKSEETNLNKDTCNFLRSNENILKFDDYLNEANKDKDDFKLSDRKAENIVEGHYNISDYPVESTESKNDYSNKNPFGVDQVAQLNEDIIETIADTIVLTDDTDGTTMNEMEQVLLEEDNLFFSGTPQHYRVKLSDGDIFKLVENMDYFASEKDVESSNIQSGSERKSSVKDEDKDKRQSETVTQQQTDDLKSRATSLPRESDKGYNPYRADSFSASKKFPKQSESFTFNRSKDTCENCTKTVAGRDSRPEDHLFLNESEFEICGHIQSDSPTSFAEDLEDLKNLCHLLHSPEVKNEKPLLKFVCIQIGEKYIFIKKVGGRLFVRYNRQWRSLVTLIEDISNSKSNTTVEQSSQPQ